MCSHHYWVKDGRYNARSSTSFLNAATNISSYCWANYSEHLYFKEIITTWFQEVTEQISVCEWSSRSARTLWIQRRKIELCRGIFRISSPKLSKWEQTQTSILFTSQAPVSDKKTKTKVWEGSFQHHSALRTSPGKAWGPVLLSFWFDSSIIHWLQWRCPNLYWCDKRIRPLALKHFPLISFRKQTDLLLFV